MKKKTLKVRVMELEEQIQSLEETNEWLKMQLLADKYALHCMLQQCQFETDKSWLRKLWEALGGKPKSFKAELPDYLKGYSEKFEEYLKQERLKQEKGIYVYKN